MRSGRIVTVSLVIFALLVALLGIFMPDIRDALVFKPKRDQAQAVVLQLAEREAAMRRSKGHFELFTPGTATMHLPALGMSSQNWPFEDFVFEASALPDKGLRIRALPRPEAVQGLRVGPQMFVVELAPSGGIGRSGWYP